MIATLLATALLQQDTLVFESGKGPGKGKHIVFLAGDEEYRSERGLPEIARILARDHGFKCTVVFSLNDKGEIDPNVQDNQPGIEALDKADLCVMQLRFRCWPDGQMAHFIRYFESGKPILALRTSTHAFSYADDSTSPYRHFSWRSKEWPGGFGKQVLGETWVTHWGQHGVQGTKGVFEEGARPHPVFRGVDGLFGTTDVYEVHLPSEAQVLMRGQVCDGMTPDAPAAIGEKKNALGQAQPLNAPMMPLVWTRKFNHVNRQTTQVLATTLATSDLTSEPMYRFLINGCYWLVGLNPPSPAPVRRGKGFQAGPFGFDRFTKGVRPSDLLSPP